MPGSVPGFFLREMIVIPDGEADPGSHEQDGIRKARALRGISLAIQSLPRHHRPRAGDPDPKGAALHKMGMAGTSPAMTGTSHRVIRAARLPARGLAMHSILHPIRDLHCASSGMTQ